MYKACNNSKYGSHGKYIMEVGNNVVSIMKDNIKGRIGKNNAC